VVLREVAGHPVAVEHLVEEVHPVAVEHLVEEVHPVAAVRLVEEASLEGEAHLVTGWHLVDPLPS
jgi:hypothetical protein